MKFITTTIRIELDLSLNEVATIEQDENGIWGFETNRGYNTWGSVEFKTFDKAFSQLKNYEKNCLIDAKYN